MQEKNSAFNEVLMAAMEEQEPSTPELLQELRATQQQFQMILRQAMQQRQMQGEMPGQAPGGSSPQDTGGRR